MLMFGTLLICLFVYSVCYYNRPWFQNYFIDYIKDKEYAFTRIDGENTIIKIDEKQHYMVGYCQKGQRMKNYIDIEDKKGYFTVEHEVQNGIEIDDEIKFKLTDNIFEIKQFKPFHVYYIEYSKKMYITPKKIIEYN